MGGPEVDGDRRLRLEALFSDHGEAIFAFARRRTSAAEADEVVSETFLVAWRRIDDVPAHALPWLLGVARNTLANRRRGETRQAALHLRLAHVADTSSSGRAAEEPDRPDRPDAEAVLGALASLSTAERDTLTLLAWDGLTAEEAASVLGCSRAAIYVRIHRARRRFVRSLDRGSAVANPTEAP